MTTALFLFTRDLRIYDNTTLNHMLKTYDRVIPAFIFNPEQVGVNEYKSNNSIQFMCESLVDLNVQLRAKNSRLHCFHGYPIDILKRLTIDAIGINIDYSPFAVARQKSIEKLCAERKWQFSAHHDYLLTDTNMKQYVKFTPFHTTAAKLKVRAPATSKGVFAKIALPGEINIASIHGYYKKNANISVRGGRTNALTLLRSIKSYDRDTLPHKTTMLSAYLKFNVISIREAYYAMRSTALRTQFYWREYYMLLQATPPVDRKMKWKNSIVAFKRWCDGTTGVPVVDAGMRELNLTGYMHNRARMCTATFLVKALHIDWKWGEKYFATKLTDYSYESNRGGWQWSAGIGASSQPFFRRFNYDTQAKTYDPSCKYIKMWVPELANVDIKTIHNWVKNKGGDTYIKPMVDDFDLAHKRYVGMWKGI
jgi:deoxyribodipyrimidine photo-lyase